MGQREDDTLRLWTLLCVLALMLVGGVVYERIAKSPIYVLATVSPVPSPRVPEEILTVEPVNSVGWLDLADKVASVVGASVGVVALIVAFVQLRPFLAEHRRISEELDRHPALCISLERCGDELEHVPILAGHMVAQFVNDSEISEAAHLEVYFHNVGDKSARDLMWTFELLDGIDVVLAKTAVEFRLTRAANGQSILVAFTPYLHRFDAGLFQIAIRVPRDVSGFEYELTVSLADEGSVKKRFEMNVEELNLR